MDDELDLLDGSIDPTYTGKRPTFLTVLCILTFVGVGFSLLYSLFQWWQISLMETAAEAFGALDMGDVFDEDIESSFTNAYKWMKISLIVNIIGAIFCLAGALVMWNMRKVGFLIYVLGQAGPIIVSVLTIGSTMGGMFAGLGVMFAVVGMIFPIGFIVMYGLNYRYLR